MSRNFLGFILVLLPITTPCSQSYYRSNWDNVLLEDGFEDELSWELFEELVDSTCYGHNIGQIRHTTTNAHTGQFSLEVTANKLMTSRSNHVIAGKKIFNQGIEGEFNYQLSAFVPAFPAQTGPEFSVQNTLMTEGIPLTFTAGIQYVANPEVDLPGLWQIWHQGKWEPFFYRVLESGTWYRFELSFTYSNDGNQYKSLVIEQMEGAADTIDLSPYLMVGEDKGFDPALWVTLEVENLWTGCSSITTQSVFYDDVSLQGRKDLPLPCSVVIGSVIDEGEDSVTWRLNQGNGGIAEGLQLVSGVRGYALELAYDLGTQYGAWAQLQKQFSTPIDLQNHDHLRFFYRGTTKNALEVGVITQDGRTYFATKINDVTHQPQFTYVTFDLRDFKNSEEALDRNSKITSIFISVVLKNNGLGGEGKLAMDDFQLLRLKNRSVPEAFEVVHRNALVSYDIASWMAGQLQTSSLLPSWEQDVTANAWLYDQAIGLIVLTESEMEEADRLAGKLYDLQDSRGWWYAGYNYSTEEPLTEERPVGAIAWAVYALQHYASIAGDSIASQAASKGATWLASLQRPNGSMPALPGEQRSPTEPNLDAWWAFQSAGLQEQADKLEHFLMQEVWDTSLGRFKADTANYQLFLDNQTWGACFLRAVGREKESRQALSYARHTLTTHHTFEKRHCGLDGAGPFGVWNEGTLQYVVARGENSAFYLDAMNRMWDKDMGLAGALVDFNGYVVWLTTSKGIAPAAWLFFANHGGPFFAAKKTSSQPGMKESDGLLSPISYPNPFRETTEIHFQLPTSGAARVSIFNAYGLLIKLLVEKALPTGKHVIVWDGRDQYGYRVPDGIYYFQVETTREKLGGKMLLKMMGL